METLTARKHGRSGAAVGLFVTADTLLWSMATGALIGFVLSFCVVAFALATGTVTPVFFVVLAAATVYGGIVGAVYGLVEMAVLVPFTLTARARRSVAEVARGIRNVAFGVTFALLLSAMGVAIACGASIGALTVAAIGACLIPGTLWGSAHLAQSYARFELRNSR